MGGSNFVDRLELFEIGNAKLRELNEIGGSNFLDRLGLLENFNSGQHNLNKAMVPFVSTKSIVLSKQHSRET